MTAQPTSPPVGLDYLLFDPTPFAFPRPVVPLLAPQMPLERWFDLMRVDKKAEAGAIRYVVIETPGRAGVRSVSDDVVAQVISRHSAAA